MLSTSYDQLCDKFHAKQELNHQQTRWPNPFVFFRRLGELHGTISGGDLKVRWPRPGYDMLPVIVVTGEGDGRQVGGTKPLGF